MPGEVKALASIALVVFSTLGNMALATTLDAEAVERVIAVDRESRSTHADKLITIESRFSPLKSAYERLTDNLQAASLHELENVWRLAGFMAYATNQYEFVSTMLKVDDELRRRKIAPPIGLTQSLRDHLVAFRRFDEARSYAAKADLPIEHIPPIRTGNVASGSGFSVLRVDVEQGTLVRDDVALDEDLHVFVVSFIGCAFSRRAANAIEKHELLKTFMHQRSTWVVLPGPLFFNDVRAWNRDHPSTGFAYVGDMERWSFIDDWATPVFYVLKRGKVVAKLKGWPDDTDGTTALLQLISANRDSAMNGPGQ